MLRSKRLSLGYELNEIAVALRIRLAYLEAIEQGRFNDLPGATYAHGFLRTYAEHLGLDPQLVLRRFKEETSGGMTAKPELYLPKPAPESRIPGGALLLLAVLLAGSAYGGWYYMNSTGRELVDFVPELPERLASALNIAPAAPAPGLVVPVTPTEPAADVVSASTARGRGGSDAVNPRDARSSGALRPIARDLTARRHGGGASDRTGRGRRGREPDRRIDTAQRPALRSGGTACGPSRPHLRRLCRCRLDRWRACRCRQRHRERPKRGRATPASTAPPAVSRVSRSALLRIAGYRSATEPAIC